ncbi:MAG: phospholipase D-like domain-containing protein [Gammaproteobacteria bacterium]
MEAMTHHVEERVFLKGDDYFSQLLVDIASAQHTIFFEAYIFEADALGEKIADALSQAARRGVKVQVLVDGVGSPHWGNALTQQLESHGVETRVFHPFPWQLAHWQRMQMKVSFLFRMGYLFAQINSRNHRKTCLIDEQIVYVGSANIHHHHLSLAQGGAGWRDTVVRLVGVPVDDLIFAQMTAWNHVSIPEHLYKLFGRPNVNAVIRLNYSRHRRRIFYKNLLRRLAKCRHRVWITNAYFVPDNRLLKNLRDLAQTGVDVRIILPHKSDILMMPWASAIFYQSLLKAGVRIFEYTPAMLHAKSLIIDHWFLVGSSNLNHRSLLHDLEVDASLKSRQAKQMLMEQFLHDMKNSVEITLESWNRRPWYQKWLGHVLLYLKYWI